MRYILFSKAIAGANNFYFEKYYHILKIMQYLKIKALVLFLIEFFTKGYSRSVTLKLCTLHSLTIWYCHNLYHVPICLVS